MTTNPIRHAILEHAASGYQITLLTNDTDHMLTLRLYTAAEQQAHWVHDLIVAGLRQLDPERFSNAGASIGDAKALGQIIDKTDDWERRNDKQAPWPAELDRRELEQADMADVGIGAYQGSNWSPSEMAERADSVWQRALRAIDEEHELDRFWVLLGCGVAAAVGLAMLGRWAVDAVWQAL